MSLAEIRWNGLYARRVAKRAFAEERIRKHIERFRDQSPLQAATILIVNVR